MVSIREVLADNLRKNRQRRCLTQEQLAEKAAVSTHYIAMIEIRKTFPKPEMLEQLAAALGIEPHELFYVPPSAENALERLQKSVVENIEQAVTKAIKQAFANEKQRNS